jgi:predicted phosphodiesterase
VLVRGRLPSREQVSHVGSPVAVAVVALLAAGLAMAAWGGAERSIGPLQARLSVVPSFSGGVTVGVPPLGRLDMATHAGPLQVRATVTGVDPQRARSLLGSERPGRTITRQVTEDSQDALAAAVARGVVVALLAAVVTCAVVFRRRRAVLGGTALVAGVLVASGGIAAGTLRTEALTEPRFDGLLEQAPVLVGRVQDFDAYSNRLAELTSNVARVYGSLGTLPVAPDADATRVLWVSDVHNNPQSFLVMRQLIEQFDVAAVVDVGDITDLGSVPENRFLTPIGTLGVPYLYVRGNHDSRAVTQAFIARQPGAKVLDDGDVVEVGGVRFAGIGDPLFRPNKEVSTESEANNAKLLAAGEQLAEAIRDSDVPVDVALVHEPKMAPPLFGEVPLVLAGHTHKRGSRIGDGTLELTQGSAGGAGLRTLDGDAPQPLEMSVLHFDRTGALIAVDDITIGGLGQRSVTVERRTPDSYGDPEDDPPTE